MKNYRLMFVLCGLIFCGTVEAVPGIRVSRGVYSTSRGHRTNSINNLKQISNAIQTYFIDNDCFPGSFNDMRDYVGGIAVNNYAWVMPARVRIVANPSVTPVAFEKPSAFDGQTDRIAVLYADGHVSTVTIPGASKLSCRKVAEFLTGQIDDSGMRKKIIERAAQEDK